MPMIIIDTSFEGAYPGNLYIVDGIEIRVSYSHRREKCSPPIRLTGCEDVLPINPVSFLAIADSESRAVIAK